MFCLKRTVSLIIELLLAIDKVLKQLKTHEIVYKKKVDITEIGNLDIRV